MALLFVLVLAGCSSLEPAPPGYYRIRSGDTLSGIARRYKVGYKTLARWNKLGPPYRIYAGSLLRVKPPWGKSSSTNRGTQRTVKTAKRSRGKKKAAAKTSTKTTRRAPGKRARVASGLRWRWPLGGKVVQRFRSGDRTQQGIRIAGRPGQKVVAAESGTVVYSNSGLKGYGNLIIIKHAKGYLSAYGFNRRLLVSEGARVKRGQGIAEVGQASDGAYRLHFEVRRKGTPVDPLRYLP
ncbi:peptidoglycan DD-metalloendopeptidase family protein [Candidatus Thiosymbion oneisti]|uniref:peptidoglycan DD-metalloendopeptidase family protein n=1 Tax=Candidatus Thiosymbion oneisti TaxID=589554 RepID=UPI000AB1B3BB|nr:peptidoglycan DD-metalloendopeptidase family protein [Candidatus Thiosymbion oneisti]